MMLPSKLSWKNDQALNTYTLEDERLGTLKSSILEVGK